MTDRTLSIVHFFIDAVIVLLAAAAAIVLAVSGVTWARYGEPVVSSIGDLLSLLSLRSSRTGWVGIDNVVVWWTRLPLVWVLLVSAVVVTVAGSRLRLPRRSVP